MHTYLQPPLHWRPFTGISHCVNSCLISCLLFPAPQSAHPLFRCRAESCTAAICCPLPHLPLSLSSPHSSCCSLCFFDTSQFSINCQYHQRCLFFCIVNVNQAGGTRGIKLHAVDHGPNLAHLCSQFRQYRFIMENKVICRGQLRALDQDLFFYSCILKTNTWTTNCGFLHKATVA